MDHELDRATYVAQQNRRLLEDFVGRHEQNCDLLLGKGSVWRIPENRLGNAARALVVAQYEYVIRHDVEAARRSLAYVDQHPPGFADCVRYLREAMRGERPWDNTLLSLSDIEVVICLMLLGDFERIASEYEAVLTNESLFQPNDVLFLRPVLCRHLILASQGRGREITTDHYEKPVKRAKDPVFRNYHLLLLALGRSDAESFNAELAKLYGAFGKRKSSRLMHAEWGFGEATQWCFDVLGTAVCRLAHRQGLRVINPNARLYPEDFWRD